MDLLATVRKEGSRGGRGDFKWSDVQNSSHRENYLGHSLMAPVGRWQKGRDLSWYSKGDTDGDGEDPAAKAARERKEELRRVKEAEQDAMSRALGLPVPDRSNANLQELSNKREFDKAMKEAVEDEGGQGGQGVGFGRGMSGDRDVQVTGERIEGNADAQDREMQYALREYRRRHGEGNRRRRSRSRDREPRSHKRDRSREHRTKIKQHDSSRSGHRDRTKHSRSRSRSRSRDRKRGDHDRRRDRNRSPYSRHEGRSERRQRYD